MISAATWAQAQEPVQLVLAGPLFWQFNKIHYEYILKLWHTHCTHLLQLDHFKSPFYAPDEPNFLTSPYILYIPYSYIHTQGCSKLFRCDVAKALWPKGHSSQGSLGACSSRKLLLRPFFAKKISVKFLVRGMVGVCGYAPAAIIYLPCSRTCKGVNQLVLSVCQTCARNQMNRVSGVDSKSL